MQKRYFLFAGLQKEEQIEVCRGDPAGRPYYSDQYINLLGSL